MNDISKDLTEFIASWFALMDHRVRWHTKGIVLIEIGSLVLKNDLCGSAGKLEGMARAFTIERKQRGYRFMFTTSIIGIASKPFLALLF